MIWTSFSTLKRPPPCVHRSRKSAGFRKLVRKRRKISRDEEHTGRPGEWVFAWYFWIWPALGSFCVNPRRRRRGRRSVLRKLKICKFGLVFGKICFFLESLSSVAVFGWILAMQIWGRWWDESCQSVARRRKQYVFGFKISQILWAVFWIELVLSSGVSFHNFGWMVFVSVLIAWFWIFVDFFLGNGQENKF